MPASPAADQLRARAWNTLTRAQKPLTAPQLGTLAYLTDGGALTFLQEWTTAGRLVCLPDLTRNAPFFDQYATPALLARLDIDRSPTMTPPTTTAPPAPEPDRPPMLAAALAYAENGWHVFPLVPDQKRPAVKDWETRATTDPARIERCWSSIPPAGPYGIGIACGPSGLVVIDLDQPKPDTPPAPSPFNIPGVRDGGDAFAVVCATAFEPVPWDTYTVRTGRGGAHGYYTHPTPADGWDGPPLRNTAGTLGWLIDTRAHGGYVVAPPSTVDGRPYDVDYGGPAAPLPLWLAKTLTPREIPAHKPVSVALSTACGPAGNDRRAAYLTAALNQQIGAVLTAGEGKRNRALYLSAVALGQLAAGGELQEGAVTGLLENAAETAGLTHFEAVRTIASGMRAGAKRPRTLTTGHAGSGVAA